jgi:hypothetical protein
MWSSVVLDVDGEELQGVLEGLAYVDILLG